MKKYKSLSVLFVVFVLFGLENCRKGRSDRSSLSANQELIETAREYFQQNVQSSGSGMTGNPRLDAARNPEWGLAYCARLSKGEAVVVPVFYRNDLVVTSNFSGRQILPLNQLTKLVIYMDSSGYHPEVVTSFPDSSIRGINTGGFSGIVFVETWVGQALKSYRYSRGKIWEKQGGSGTQKGIAKTVIPDAVKTPETIITTCYEISGYNYSADDPEDGYYWTESAGCDYQFIPSIPSGGGLSGGDYGSIAGAGGNSSGTSGIALASGNNIIGNITDYMKCFSNYGGNDHTYRLRFASVSRCRDRGRPGQRRTVRQEHQQATILSILVIPTLSFQRYFPATALSEMSDTIHKH